MSDVPAFLIPVLIVVLSLIEGSFLTALIHRLYTGVSIVWGRSACPHCRHVLNPADLVPLLSYLALRGRCRYCRKPIRWTYPAIEAAVLIANLGLFLRFGMSATFIFDAVVTGFLIVIFVYDQQHQLILDRVALPGAAIALLGHLLLGRSLFELLLGGILGAGFFLVQYVVSRGRWIGGGDIRLGLLMGFALGWPHILVALFGAYVLGATVSVGLILTRRVRWTSMVPFGTFLSVATYLTMIAGGPILDWYRSLLTI